MSVNKTLTLLAVTSSVGLLSLISACSSGDSTEPSQPPAGKTYTPVELHAMIGKGSYPDQYPPTSQKQMVAFERCVALVKSAVDAVKPNYPAHTIFDTAIMYMEKVWTNDGALTMTCSKPDLALIITNARYR